MSYLPIHTSIAYFSQTRHRGMSEDCDYAQDLIEDLKAGEITAIDEIADILASHPELKGFDGIVTPAPRSTASRLSNMKLAQALVRRGVGHAALPMVSRVSPVSSSRLRRQRGLPRVPYEQHVESMAFVGEPSDEPVLIVDDMFTSGSTLLASADVIQAAGHTGPIEAAAAGFYIADPSEYLACPYQHQTFEV